MMTTYGSEVCCGDAGDALLDKLYYRNHIPNWRFSALVIRRSLVLIYRSLKFLSGKFSYLLVHMSSVKTLKSSILL
jgi:hypothetical protein